MNNTPDTFKLETAIETWLQQYQLRDVFSPDDLVELEQHLRDEVDELVAAGQTPKAAFDLAIQEMGDWDSAEAEYGKVFWSKAKREQRLTDVFAARLSMYRSYSLVAFRSMFKQKVYASINILGLAAGLASFILIFLFVQFELNYDRFYDEVDQIYRVTKRNPGDVYLGTDHFALTQAPLATLLKQEFEEIESATSFGYIESLIDANNNTFWENGLEADQSFFNVFRLGLVSGDTATALANPGSIVLTESFSKKIYGDGNAVGQHLTRDEETQYQVTGIIADPPKNSTIQYQYLTSIVSDDFYRAQIAQNRWNNNYLYTFFRLQESVDIASLSAGMPAFVDKYLYPDRPEIATDDKESFYFQSLYDVHLNSSANFDLGRHGNKTQVYLFMGIAIVILLLACINYINLAVARSLKRAPEVGLRKTVGAFKSQLLRQFLGESLLITLVAMLLALVTVYLCLPFFADVVNREIAFSDLGNKNMLVGLILLTFFTAGASGFYPAFLMASLNPIEALKKRISNFNVRFNFQNALVIAQFTASIILVTCGYIIYQQLDFVRNKEMGYDREHIVSVKIHDNNRALKENIGRVQASLLSHANIIDVSASHTLPTNITMQQTIVDWEGAAEDERLFLHVNPVDYNFLSLFGIELVSGRPFSKNIATDAQFACIINETTAKSLGWTINEALGQSFIHDDTQRTVVGVIKDFHLHSVHHAIQPLLLFVDDGGRFDNISIKLAPNSLPQALDTIEETIQQISAFPFEYAFVDEQFDRLYAQEARLGETFGFFTAIAFLIASLGLFGLAAFTAEQRTKEIGVRKVLGASSSGIVWMLSKEFSRLVLVASVVACPIAYFITSRWLESFAYRVELTPALFITTTLAALAIALLSVGYQSLRAAVANPVTSLQA